MNTDDFIAAIGADASAKVPNLTLRLAGALALGACVSFVLFMSLIAPRPDAAQAMHTMRFDLKFLDTLALLAPSFFLCLRLSRPEASPRALLGWLLIPIAILAVAVGVELTTVPQEKWMVKLIGTNARHCLTFVPLFALAPLAAALVALREGAPRYPALTGALAGAAAAGIGATLYATSCPDDSPLFVATWYPLATVAVAALGAAVGARVLRW